MLISPFQLRAASNRAKRLDASVFKRGTLDFIPGQPRQTDAESIARRAAFVSASGAAPGGGELERIIGSNDLVEEFYFDRALLAAMPVCRIILRSASDHVRGYATGFMVSPRLLLTNEHVFTSAAEAAPSLAEFNYRLDVAGNPEPSYRFALRPDLFFFNHRELDFALVSVEPRSLDGGVALSAFGYHRLIPDTGKILLKEWMTIIQHPAGAPRQWAIRENQCVNDSDPHVVWYSSDTAPGSSGSPVLNDSFQVVALHHSGVPRQDKSGKYLLKNGQKADGLGDVDDSQVDWVANAGIRVSRICACIDESVREANGHLAELKAAQQGGDVLTTAYKNPRGEAAAAHAAGANPGAPGAAAPNAASASPGAGGRIVVGTLVLELNGALPGLHALPGLGSMPGAAGGAGAAKAAMPSAASAAASARPLGSDAAETQKVPFVDDDYASRKGYATRFLGLDTPLPDVTDPRVIAPTLKRGKILHYEHFSVVMHKTRKLAIYTASNVDGRPRARRPEAGHAYTRKELTGLGDNQQEKWLTDRRMDEKYQVPDKFYTRDNGAFDKGHIVRREDVCWGDSFAQVQRANGDTFHVTNCSPQRGNFNRSNKNGIWGELENYIGAQADAERYCIFAGPVLSEADKVFSGTEEVQIPDRFWKVVCAVSAGKLQTFAFVLEQDLTDLPLEFQVDAEWKHKQVTLAELEKLVKLVKFPAVYHRADQKKRR